MRTARDALAHGNNVLQSTSLPNNGAGLCLNITADKNQMLYAQGNVWVSGGAAIDCATTSGMLTESTADALGGDKRCGGCTDIGGTGLSLVVRSAANAVNAVKLHVRQHRERALQARRAPATPPGPLPREGVSASRHDG